ncbi:hypothetical protein HK405_013266 [Cladochytrium tenue]|nr:hypothetical protein HK405_013266 [Cladochytrium tenue]
MTSSPPRPLRVAVLVCDPLNTSVIAVSGTSDSSASVGPSHAALFTHRLSAAAARLGAAVVTAGYDAYVGDLPPDPAAFDILLLTGSIHGVNDAGPEVEWIRRLVAYIADVVRTDKAAVVGMCFGLQVIAAALGGSVAENPKGWEVGYTSMSLTESGQRYFGSRAPAAIGLLSIHQDEATAVPPGVDLLMSSDKCAVQAFVKENSVFAMQSHPEFNRGIVRELVRYVHLQACELGGAQGTGGQSGSCTDLCTNYLHFLPMPSTRDHSIFTHETHQFTPAFADEVIGKLDGGDAPGDYAAGTHPLSSDWMMDEVVRFVAGRAGVALP